jgi:U3 small nucleolar ribonucleoprotein protein IMP4
MLRREARLRKEFLYRKALEENERKLSGQKDALQQALDTNKPIPRELRKDAVKLANSLTYDNGARLEQTHQDDEYAYAGIRDPKILITTSRDPSSRLQQFAKELRLIFPNSQRINRGNYVVSEITAACRANEVTDLIVVHEHRGVPDGLIISHFPYGPTAYFSLSNVVLRHDLPEVMEKKVSEVYPHLIFSNFTTKLAERTMSILRYLFPVPKEESRRTISFINQNDYISFRHHTFSGLPNTKNDVELTEVGPRFEMRLFQIKLGTVEITEVDTEWALRQYKNTAKKRTVL